MCTISPGTFCKCTRASPIISHDPSISADCSQDGATKKANPTIAESIWIPHLSSAREIYGRELQRDLLPGAYVKAPPSAS